MFPTYVAIDKAVSLIREKCGEHGTADGLLQYAHEGKIQLFALVREPVYFIERRDILVDQPHVGFAKVLWEGRKDYKPPSGQTKSLTNRATASRVQAERGSKPTNIPPEVQRISDAIFGLRKQPSDQKPKLQSKSGEDDQTAALNAYEKMCSLEQILMPTDFQKVCFSIADYIALSPICAGQIFASRNIPRATDIVEMFVNGKWRPVFISNKPGWRVTENELFLLTVELEHLFRPSEEIDKRKELEVSKGVSEPLAMTNIDTPPAVTKKRMCAAPWPLQGINVEKILSDPPNWAKDARVYRIGPGNGSSLWNPAMFAYLLATTSSSPKRPKINRLVLDVFIRRYFPESINAWEDLADYILPSPHSPSNVPLITAILPR
ncbi:MAG: hypothetical protein M3Q16_07970 [Pseudomonadota bacterium]|nr:hypothetical protein [Pseudomonadota bacterium]